MAARGNGQRIFILVIVAVFFLSSVAITGAVILDQIQQDKIAKEAQTQLEAQKSIQEQLNDQQANTEGQPETEEGTLKGTKLEGFEPVASVDKIQIIDKKVGTGKEVAAGGVVTAHYTGALAKDGTIFESSFDSGQPATFPLDNVIQGWQEGVPGMKEGGERRLIIPAALAYGESGSASIPPNSDLVFDIVLVSVGE